MKILETLTFDAEEQSLLARCKRWINLLGDKQTEEERNKRMLVTEGGTWTKERLVEYAVLWQAVLLEAQDRHAEMEDILPMLPESTTNGFFVRPKQAGVMIRDSMLQAIEDIYLLLKILSFASSRIREPRQVPSPWAGEGTGA